MANFISATLVQHDGEEVETAVNLDNIIFVKPLPPTETGHPRVMLVFTHGCGIFRGLVDRFLCD